MDLINYFILQNKIENELKEKLLILYKERNKHLNNQFVNLNKSLSNNRIIDLILNSNLIDNNLKQIVESIKVIINSENNNIQNKDLSLFLLNKLNYLLNQLPMILFNYYDCVNGENEKVVNEIKEKGNKEFYKKNYKQAISFYQDAIRISFNENNTMISNDTKSILLSNFVTTIFEYSNKYNNDNGCNCGTCSDIQEFEMYDLLDTALSNIIKCLTLRPNNWSKAYFKFGKICSKIGLYNLSLDSFNAVILLEDQQQQPSLLKQQSLECINNLKLKLNSRFYNTIDGSRDFIKETNNQIEKSKENIKLISRGLYIDNDFRNFLSRGSGIREFNKHCDTTSKLLGIPIRLVHEVVLYNIISISMANSLINKSDALVLTQRMIGGGGGNNNEDDETSLIAFPYYLLAKWRMCSCSKDDMVLPLPVEKNNECILTLLLKASSLPFKLYNDNEIDHDLMKRKNIGSNGLFLYTLPLSKHQKENVLSAHAQLALIYKYAKFGQDYDLEKSIYHFEFIISNLNNENEKECKELYKVITTENKISCPFYELGQMYYFGKTSFTTNEFIVNVNKEKAKKLFIQGSKFGSEFCQKYLNKYYQ